MDFIPLRKLIIFTALCGWLTPAAFAVLRAPLMIQQEDSASVQYNQGVEYSRLTDYFSDRRKWNAGLVSVVSGKWKSEWQEQRGGTNRLRQDGNWYVGAAKPVANKLHIWGAGYGEHFDDRPIGQQAAATVDANLLPQSPNIGFSNMLMSGESTTSNRILRGGAGLSYQPIEALSIHSGAGLVDDKRIGEHEAGLGFWSAVELDEWMTAGYVHNGSLKLKRESPPNHYSLDLTGDYELYREFFPGNTNRAQITAGMIERDVYRGPTIPASRRSERQVLLRDDLEYEIADQVSVSMSGDFQRETTDLGGEGGSGSDLEEQQTGVSVALKGAYRKSAATGLHVGALRFTDDSRRDIERPQDGSFVLRVIDAAGSL